MMSKRFAVFFVLFTVMVFVATKINVASLVGAQNQFFTLYQFFGPIAGGILGPFVGAAAVLAAQLLNFIASGSDASLITFLRMAPMLGAAFYFGKQKSRLALLAPVLAIAAFVMHPVGREVWYYSLFWTVPLIAALFPQRLFLRSLGSTFTAHAIGGAIWIWTIPMTPQMWIALIPVVIVERTLFAAGIAISYVGMNTLVSRLEQHLPVVADARYVFSRGFVRSLAHRL